ncbi:hypothetical protein GA0111570_103294 [Raineyella antarctica]|uniref:SPW repeat-containing integral membrane domain-containing protein n=1 Tax=Raineyella antarctica TaxID=1577474 RepID=A0A1G6GHY6_9ACTN|nr:hypothetical protein [Raineyella antarctica]SDB81509.1 hypothetical protein GA0111570_103294 [Raineyella antarctica]
MSTRQTAAKHPVMVMLARKHWEDWVTLVAGLVLALTPVWNSSNRAIWLVPLGVLLILMALGSEIWDKLSEAAEGVVAVIGALIIVAPIIGGFAGMNALALTTWTVGAVVMVMALVQVLLELRMKKTAVRRA